MIDSSFGSRIESLERFFETFIEKEKLPGVSVCVNQSGKVVWKRAFGARDDKGARLETDTIFGIASMSKGVTCAALSILEAEGKFSFYDRADKYLPKLAIPGVPRESLLVWHLATHSSGLPPLPLLAWSLAFHTPDGADDHEKLEKRRQAAASHVDTIDDIIYYINNAEYPLLAQPGLISSYSNDSFALLSYIVDAAAGMPLEEFLKKRVFEPLGMESTVLDIDASEARKLGTLTELFNKNKDGGGFNSDDYWDVAPPYRGAGWIKSTPTDMARFYEALCNGGVFRGKTVFPLAEILYGSRFPETPYDGVFGYGLEKRPFNHDGASHRIVEHAGGLHGVATKGGFIKGSDGVSACVFCNWESAWVSPLLNAVYNTMLGLPAETSHFYWRTQDDSPAEASIYVGKYHQEELFSDDIIIELRPEGLVTMDDGKPVPLKHCGTTRFVALEKDFPIDRCDRYQFILDDRGAAQRLRVGSRVYTRI
ncbi:MAG: beta-lactamase family protein [Oscillospiraceae bacterium]|jgi:CubicO group peptidase (beta-lactamase class C family)|nr:beta-lactamase family protein [Oscillospiraceae bacterium]